MILYFSATGNTKYCAEYIASRTDDRIISVNDLMKLGASSVNCEGAERLGIFVPVYAWDFPRAVSDFLEAFRFEGLPSDCYVYGVFTCGSNAGRADETMSKILDSKGITLDAAFAVSMPDNYVLMFPTENPERRIKHLTDADTALKEFAEDISAKRHAAKMTKKPSKLFVKLVQKFFVPSSRKVKGFRVNDDCIGCGLCARVCPMNIIELREGRPVWTKDSCACCLGCLHRCPSHAINRGRSAKNGRYINPNVTL
ncbi:MAG: EFR1 family ferrodoxin [Synergistaceae bacterium]|nr:EFR1 family ferrodoxin [Synergistaceae bacterium]